MDGQRRALVWVFFFLSCVYTVYGGAGNPWTYNGTLGPAHWHVDYPHCGGKKQSPININTEKVEFDGNLAPFDLSDLEQTEGVNMTLSNVQGHTVEVILSGSTNMVVRGGSLGGDFLVKQFHFHWGQRDERGSEHDINKKQFPMEMHIVMYSTNFADINVALDKPKGLAVLAFLFQVGETNNNFEPILSHFEQIQHSGNETSISTISLKSLLPDNTEKYYRYAGSLTTPPCYESVIWTVFSNHITVSEEQLEKFRHIKRNRAGIRDENLVDDFRPLQELNHRKVYTNDISLSSSPGQEPLHLIPILLSLTAYIFSYGWS